MNFIDLIKVCPVCQTDLSKSKMDTVRCFHNATDWIKFNHLIVTNYYFEISDDKTKEIVARYSPISKQYIIYINQIQHFVPLFNPNDYKKIVDKYHKMKAFI